MQSAEYATDFSKWNSVTWRFDLTVGYKVKETDSGVVGTIIEIHNRYSVTHAVMEGDNGEIYDHNLSHYKPVKRQNILVEWTQ